MERTDKRLRLRGSQRAEDLRSQILKIFYVWTSEAGSLTVYQNITH